MKFEYIPRAKGMFCNAPLFASQENQLRSDDIHRTSTSTRKMQRVAMIQSCKEPAQRVAWHSLGRKPADMHPNRQALAESDIQLHAPVCAESYVSPPCGGFLYLHDDHGLTPEAKRCRPLRGLNSYQRIIFIVFCMWPLLVGCATNRTPIQDEIIPNINNALLEFVNIKNFDFTVTEILSERTQREEGQGTVSQITCALPDRITVALGFIETEDTGQYGIDIGSVIVREFQGPIPTYHISWQNIPEGQGRYTFECHIVLQIENHLPNILFKQYDCMYGKWGIDWYSDTEIKISITENYDIIINETTESHDKSDDPEPLYHKYIEIDYKWKEVYYLTHQYYTLTRIYSSKQGRYKLSYISMEYQLQEKDTLDMVLEVFEAKQDWVTYYNLTYNTPGTIRITFPLETSQIKYPSVSDHRRY